MNASTSVGAFFVVKERRTYYEKMLAFAFVITFIFNLTGCVDVKVDSLDADIGINVTTETKPTQPSDSTNTGISGTEITEQTVIPGATSNSITATSNTEIATTHSTVSETTQIVVPTTVPTTTPTSVPTVPPTITQGSIGLNRKDVSLSYKGESWDLYSGDIAKNLITWSSDDESVATFVDGKVIAVGSGMTKVHASFGDQKVSCIIRCRFKESTDVGANGGVSEDAITKDVVIDLQGRAEYSRCKISVKRDGVEVLLTTVPKGTPSVTLEKQVGSGTVYYTVLIDDSDGWVQTEVFISQTPTDNGGGTGTGAVTGKIVNVQDSINVRTGPGTSYARNGVLKIGAQVTVTERKIGTDGMEWGKVAEGWVRMDYIQLDSN